LKRRHDADEIVSSGRNKKPRMNTFTGSEPEEDVLVVSMVSARIQLTFTANSSPPCDSCRESKRECTGRTHTACDACQPSKKACKVGSVSTRVLRSTKQVANSVIPVEESNAAVGKGLTVEAAIREHLELAKRVQAIEALVHGLYSAALSGDELQPILSAFVTAFHQLRGAQQTDDHESVD
jgi:hypothetical protein